VPCVDFQQDKIKTQLDRYKSNIRLYPELYPKQKEASKAFAKYRLYWGAKGGGKSHWLRSEVIRQCISWANVSWLVLRRTRPEVWNNTIKYLLREIPEVYTDDEGVERRLYSYCPPISMSAVRFHLNRGGDSLDLWRMEAAHVISENIWRMSCSKLLLNNESRRDWPRVGEEIVDWQEVRERREGQRLCLHSCVRLW